MLRINGVSKQFGNQVVLDKVSFIVNEGERVGLIGPNGSGKSTTLDIIRGKLEPDRGSVMLDSKEHVGYIPQMLLSDKDDSKKVSDYLAKRLGDIIYHSIIVNRQENIDSSSEEYLEILNEYIDEDGPKRIAKLKEVLAGLGLSQIEWDRDLNSLSGGERTRLAMASVLALSPTVVLLDEPTNNLDLPGLFWLERYLLQSKCSVLLVTHDRWLLDRVVTKITELNSFTHSSTEYVGNYTDYSIESMKRREKQHQDHKDYEKEYNKVKTSIQKQKERTMSGYRGPKDNDKFIAGVRQDRSSKSAGVTSRLEKKLERIQKVEDVRGDFALKIPIRSGGSQTKAVCELSGVGFDVDGRNIFKNIDLTVNQGDKIAILGNNGSGKTTLLRILVGEISPAYGTIKRSELKIGYLPQEYLWDDNECSVIDWLRQYYQEDETELRNYLARFGFFDDIVFKKLGSLSLGERAKLRLAGLAIQRPDVLVLDEPTNHLDFDALEYCENQYTNFNGTVIIVSHDRYSLRRMNITRYFYLDSDDGLIESNNLEGVLAKLEEGRR